MDNQIPQPPIKKKHAGGRPKKTLANMNLPENWKETVFELAAKGLAKEEIYLHYYRINAHLFDKLYEKESEFCQVVKKAEQLCKGWWIETGRKSLKTKNFHDALWYMNMKNRFGWKDRTEIDHGLTDSTVEKFASLSVNELIQKANGIITGKSQ